MTTEDLVKHGPCVVWFTGLPCAGKTTIACNVARNLAGRGGRVFLLDGDSLRQGLCSDLGFSETDRSENIRRAAEVAALIADSGFIVLAAFITPRQADRDRLRARLNAYPFVEAFVDTPLTVAESRDIKGLYRRARRGDIENFTGIGAPFDVPQAPDLQLDTTLHDANTLAAHVISELVARKVLPRQRPEEIAL